MRAECSRRRTSPPPPTSPSKSACAALTWLIEENSYNALCSLVNDKEQLSAITFPHEAYARYPARPDSSLNAMEAIKGKRKGKFGIPSGRAMVTGRKRAASPSINRQASSGSSSPVKGLGVYYSSARLRSLARRQRRLTAQREGRR